MDYFVRHVFLLTLSQKSESQMIHFLDFLSAYVLMRCTPVKCTLIRLGLELYMARREARCRASTILEDTKSLVNSYKYWLERFLFYAIIVQ